MNTTNNTSNFNSNKIEHIIELYKTQVNIVQKQEDLIANTNNFYLTINTLIATVLAVFMAKDFYLLPILLTGVAISLLWHSQIIALRYRCEAGYLTLISIKNKLGTYREILEETVVQRKRWPTKFSLWVNDTAPPRFFVLGWLIAILYDVIYQ